MVRKKLIMEKREIDFYLLQMVWIVAFVVFSVFNLDSWWVVFAPSIIVILVIFVAAIVVFFKSMKK